MLTPAAQAQSVNLIDEESQTVKFKLLNLNNKRKTVVFSKPGQKKPTAILLRKLDPKSRKVVSAYFGGLKSKAFKSLSYDELKSLLLHDQIYHNEFTKEAFLSKKWESGTTYWYGSDDGQSLGIPINSDKTTTYRYNEDGTYEVSGKTGEARDRDFYRYTLDEAEKALIRRNVVTGQLQTYFVRMNDSKLIITFFNEPESAATVSVYHPAE